MRKDAKEIKFYELPDYNSFEQQYRNIVKNKDEYDALKAVYDSINATSVKLIKKFYREYWEENRGKIPKTETPKLYHDFLIKEAINLYTEIK